jgi:t-SNARE complex subunit (syntaxin)
VGGEWEMEMDVREPKLEAAEKDLKQLMADVTRAMEKAQEAVARIASKAAAATTETESTSQNRRNPGSSDSQ